MMDGAVADPKVLARGDELRIGLYEAVESREVKVKWCIFVHFYALIF